jgi:hypothetical protein
MKVKERLATAVYKAKKFLFEREGQDDNKKAVVNGIDDLFEPIKALEAVVEPVVEVSDYQADKVKTHEKPWYIPGFAWEFVGKLVYKAGVEAVRKNQGLTPRQRLKRYDSIYMVARGDSSGTGASKTTK